MALFSLYIALAFSAFTSATILPGTSEVSFALFVQSYPEKGLTALLVVGLFNSLGSIFSYGIGRFLPGIKRIPQKTHKILNRYGVWALLLAWVPIVGDGLPIAAGWLKLNIGKCIMMLIIGKMLRYTVLLLGMGTFV
ncbi:YqaA family protein [Neisseria zalophi]|uniref:DedA family protein n=1 Tax=Neisseria zalophi TaxID=640030 RepID=A0A5J6PWP5_9NEIS|nr:DedA family protein [Neisseria zalophi]QEY27238.1 DedA family protein [Neisseria zalophi]